MQDRNINARELGQQIMFAGALENFMDKCSIEHSLERVRGLIEVLSVSDNSDIAENPEMRKYVQTLWFIEKMCVEIIEIKKK